MVLVAPYSRPTLEYMLITATMRRVPYFTNTGSELQAVCARVLCVCFINANSATPTLTFHNGNGFHNTTVRYTEGQTATPSRLVNWQKTRKAGMHLTCSRRLVWSIDDRNVPDKEAFSEGRFTNLKRQAVQVPAEACLARLLQRLDKAGNSALWLRTTSQVFN